MSGQKIFPFPLFQSTAKPKELQVSCEDLCFCFLLCYVQNDRSLFTGEV